MDYQDSDLSLTLPSNTDTFRLQVFTEAFTDIQNYINGTRTEISGIEEKNTHSLSFTYVIDSDQKFSDWVNNVHDERNQDYTSVLIRGEVNLTITSQVNIETIGTKLLMGEPNAVLNITCNSNIEIFVGNFEVRDIEINYTVSYPTGSFNRALFYNNKKPVHNVIVNVVDNNINDSHINFNIFNTLYNIYDCVINISGNNVIGNVLRFCYDYIKNIKININDVQTGNIYCFQSSSSLYKCQIKNNNSNSNIISGFVSCYSVQECSCSNLAYAYSNSYSSPTNTDNRFLCADTLLGGYNSVVGQSTSATSIPADTIKTTPISTDGSYQVPFVSGVTSEYKTLYTDNTNGHLAYNPSTDTLTTSHFDGKIVWSNVTNKPLALPSVLKSIKPIYNFNSSSTWSPKTWNGLSSLDGNRIWTDGTDIYYSYNSAQYVLNKATSTWTTKTWNGLTKFDGEYIWSDGTNIYYSNGSSYQYVLDKSTSTWSTKTWSGYSNPYANNIWTDGMDIYYSSSGYQYVLNKSSSIWSTKTWSGATTFYGQSIWTDGTDIYYTVSSTHRVLDKSSSTWSTKTWSGLTNFSAQNIWTDGTNIYYSYESTQYVLDKSTSTWSVKTWSGATTFYGRSIWTDGTDIYYSYGSTQYVLNQISANAKWSLQG